MESPGRRGKTGSREERRGGCAFLGSLRQTHIPRHGARRVTALHLVTGGRFSDDTLMPPHMLLTAILVTVVGAPARSADVAELFPANTLAYAEVRRPADVTDPLMALLAHDPVARTHDRVDGAQNPQQLPGIHRAGFLGVLTTPELAAELRRLGSMGVGVVGFSARYEPRFAVAVLLGDCHAAGLLARAYLTTSPSLRRVAVVGSVPVFQHRGFTGLVLGNDGKPLTDGDQKEPRMSRPSAGADEPTYAYTPGLFVIGSDTEAVSDVLERFAGRSPSPSLTADERFRKHTATRNTGGVFFYTTLPEILTRLETATRATDGSGVDAPLVAAYKFMVGPKALNTVAGSLHVHPEAVTLTVDADGDATASSAILAALTGPPAAPPPPSAGDPVWAITLSMPTADRRSRVTLDLLDAHARTTGALGRQPSEILAEVERNGGPKVIADLLPEVRAVSVFSPSTPMLPSAAVPVPVIVLHTESASAAEAWDSAAPKLLSLLATATPTVSSEVIGDVRVRAFAAAGLPGNAPLHIARVGNRVAVGQDRALVATSVRRPSVEATIPAAGAFQLSLAALADQLYTAPSETKPKTDARPSDRTLIPRPSSSSEPATVGWAAALRSLPTVTGTVTRSRHNVRVEARWVGLKATFPAAWAAYRDWVERQPAPSTRPGYGFSISPQ